MSLYPLAQAIADEFDLGSVEENFPSDLIPDARLNPFLNVTPSVEEWEELTGILEADLQGLPSPSWSDLQASL